MLKSLIAFGKKVMTKIMKSKWKLKAEFKKSDHDNISDFIEERR